jgi:hypothetical protein
VLQGSDFLNSWFGNGAKIEIALKRIPSEYISFTLGDSCSTLYPMQGSEKGELTMYTKEELISVLTRYTGSIDQYMKYIADTYRYIEAQLWNDDYC